MQQATRKDGKVGDDLLGKLRGSAAVEGDKREKWRELIIYRHEIVRE